MLYNDPRVNEVIREVYRATDVVRKPISGIVSGYHELPYILVAPDNETRESTVQITGRINVSPRFILTPDQLAEAFGDVFDPSTFDRELHARLFSFAVRKGRNVKVASEKLEIATFAEAPKAHLEMIEDTLLRAEDLRTALIFGPRFDYYPVSIDRFVNEVVDREFSV